MSLQIYVTLPGFQKAFEASVHELEDFTDHIVVRGRVQDDEGSLAVLSAWKSMKHYNIEFPQSINGKRFTEAMEGKFLKCDTSLLELNRFI